MSTIVYKCFCRVIRRTKCDEVAIKKRRDSQASVQMHSDSRQAFSLPGMSLFELQIWIYDFFVVQIITVGKSAGADFRPLRVAVAGTGILRKSAAIGGGMFFVVRISVNFFLTVWIWKMSHTMSESDRSDAI